MKKAYTLFITLFLLVTFSLLLKYIIEVKSFKSEAIKEKVLYIQAKNHLDFLQDYILSIDLKDINSILIEDELFLIEAGKSTQFDGFLLFVKSKDFNIRVTKKLFIK